MSIGSLAQLVEQAEAAGKNISEIVLEDQADQLGKTQEQLFAEMEGYLAVMEQSVLEGCQPGVRSTSGLTGGGAALLATQAAESLGGDFFRDLLTKALAVAELNAAMGRIVASPTGGSCGILPAAVLTMKEHKGIPTKDCVMALFTAAGVGMVIAKNATVSGAEGGCQAECGSASAMAAAAMVELGGGSPAMVSHGAAIALKCLLGLVCDPVAGLVEIPCIKRNASGAANALCAAQLALAGIPSMIPADEVIVAMKKIGESMPSSLRETAEGGLAVTATGRALEEQVFGAAKTD